MRPQIRFLGSSDDWRERHWCAEVQAVHGCEGGAMTADQHEDYEERAAILEHDAGLNHDEAEREAMRMLGITPEDLIEFEAGQREDGK